MAEQSTGWRDQLARYAKAIVNEAVLPAAEKLIPQGAAELSQALFTGNGYVPYGPTEKPVPMEASSLDGALAEQPAASESEFRQYVTVDPEKQQPRGMESQSLYGPATAPEAYQPTTYESMLEGYAARGQEQQQALENER